MIPKTDGTQLETQYLLGRAWVEAWHIEGQSQDGYLKRAYNAYRQAIYNCDRCDTVWMSIGLLYYFKGQLGDCLDSFAWAVRLNPKVPLVWRNLGFLVSNTVCLGREIVKLRLLFKYEQNNQYLDALNSYEKAFELGLRDIQCLERITALHKYRTQGTALPLLTLQMEDSDISKTTCDTRKFEKDGSIGIAELCLEDECASDGWIKSSDENSDFESDLESDRW